MFSRRALQTRGFVSGRFSMQTRWKSASHQAPKKTDRLSVLTKGAVTKRDVLDSIVTSNPSTQPMLLDGDGQDAVVILASRNLAGWLGDTGFMSSLLQRLCPAEPEELHVLAAAVDALCPPAHFGSPSSGFSILKGDKNYILPRLWERQNAPQLADPPQPSLSMCLNPLLGDFRPVDVTLPLANTMFQNGRPFTLFASRWRRHGGNQPEPALTLAHLAEQTSQRVVASRQSIQAHANVSVTLFPVTAPRRILAGLGNIVRQVEAEVGAGSEAEGPGRPASEELEVNIQALINARSKLFPDDVTPIRTWALVVPENAPSLDFLSGQPVSVGDSDSVEQEHHRAEIFARHFSKVLADGGRLHRVLSGGGGWGLKKGLLSLDAQTTYSTSEAQDLESFMASFGGEQNKADGIATPGSYIQFLAEPLAVGRKPGYGGIQLPSLLLGTAPDGELDDRVDSSTPTTSPASVPSVEIIDGHFGALSSQGIFLDMTPKAEPAEVHGIGVTYTKLDSTHSYVWEGSGRWL